MVYRALMHGLHAASRADPTLQSLDAAIAVVELAGDLLTNTGLLWTNPGIPAALRTLANTLEARRDDGPFLAPHPSLRAWFASARPPPGAN
jgi:hypothetical protein